VIDQEGRRGGRGHWYDVNVRSPNISRAYGFKTGNVARGVPRVVNLIGIWRGSKANRIIIRKYHDVVLLGFRIEIALNRITPIAAGDSTNDEIRI